jgi:hypothetical protein
VTAISLPPIGFNHRYGDSPLAAKDGFAIERSLYAQRVFWEFALQGLPLKAGYIDLSKPALVTAARHAITSITVIIATEDLHTITGFLAEGSNAEQQKYAQALLDKIRAIGYDGFTSAKVLVYFTESDQHAFLLWSQKGGYKYTVNDNNLVGTGIRPAPGQTPLPLPSVP